MSKFRSLVEEILSQHSIKEDWETDLDWKKTNPYDDEDDEEYEAWLEDQDYYTRYAVYVTTDSMYGKLYAAYDGFAWGTNNELDNDPNNEMTELWPTFEEAEKALKKFKDADINENNPRVVPVYSDKEDGIYYEDKKEIYPYEKWEEEVKYGYEDRDDLFDR